MKRSRRPTGSTARRSPTRRSALGLLLLARFAPGSQRPARPKSPAEQKRGSAAEFHPALRFRLPRAPKTPPPNAVPASLPIPAPAPVLFVPAPSQPSGASGTLQTHELIRPDDRLKQSIEGFLLDQRSPHTRRAYGKDLKRFISFLLMRQAQGGTETIGRATLIAYKDQLGGEGLQATTVDRHLATLRSFFRWLRDDGLIERNPAEGVRFLNPRKLSTTIGFSDEEVRRLLKLPDLHKRTGAQHYAILMILFYCGLRRSELCALRTSSLTVERLRGLDGEQRAQQVLRLQGKGGGERLIALIPPVWNALRYYLHITRRDPAADQWLFAPIRNNRTGVAEKPLDPSMIFYLVRRYARLAGVRSRVSPHSCRATAISNARDRGVPDRAIQEFAGWASPDMITRYDKRKNAVEKSAAHAIRYGDAEEPDATLLDARLS